MLSRPLGASGRKFERILPAIQIAVCEVGSAEGMVLWNVSQGGFAIQSMEPYARDHLTRAFIFSAPSQKLSERVTARAVHSMAYITARGTSYITGFELVLEGSDLSAITRILRVAERAGVNTFAEPPDLGGHVTETHA